MFKIGTTIFAYGDWGIPYKGNITRIENKPNGVYYIIDGRQLTPTGDTTIPVFGVAVYYKTAALTWEKCKEQSDKFFSDEVEEYFSKIKGDLKAILEFPLHHDLYFPRNAAVKTAYINAMHDYLETLN